MERRAAGLCVVFLWLVGLVPALADDTSAEEQRAIVQLKKLGWLSQFIPNVDETKPGKPIVGVSLFGSHVTDAALAEIKAFKQLKRLVLSDTDVTDAGLRVLRELPDLEEVCLGDEHLTDAVIDHLRELPRLQTFCFSSTTDQTLKRLGELKNLRSLNLWENKITDAGLAEFKAPPSLEELNLGLTKIMDAGLRHVAQMRNLRSLDLRCTSVGDAGLTELRGLPRLEELILSGTKITDVGLAELRSLPNLQSLWLDRTDIDDKGLEHIAALKDLRSLGLAETKVTDQGLKHLEQLHALKELSLGDEVSDEAEAELLKKLPTLAKAREEERKLRSPKREQKTPTGASEADARLILDEVVRQLLTLTEVKDTLAFYGTKDDKRLALIADSPIAWPKDFKPSIKGYEFPWLPYSRERPRSELKKPGLAGVRIDKFDLTKPVESLLDGQIVVCIFNAGGQCGVIGGCSVYFDVAKKEGKWVVTYTGLLDP